MKNKIKKIGLIIAFAIFIWGVARFDCDGWSAMIAMGIGGAYLLLGLIANWDSLMKHWWPK